MAKKQLIYEVRKTTYERPWGIFIIGTDICLGTAIKKRTAKTFMERLNESHAENNTNKMEKK